ncbi:hypothetical protein N7540_011394 [Penicillium herquei]|nr:hypothetical protein N7540_011394 [Penicillium herquei]
MDIIEGNGKKESSPSEGELEFGVEMKKRRKRSGNGETVILQARNVAVCQKRALSISTALESKLHA